MIGIRPPGEPGHRADSSAAGSTRRHFRTSHQPSVEPLAGTADQACSPRRRQHRRAVRSHGGVLEASATPGSGPPGGTGLRSVRGRWRSKPLTLNPLTARRSGSGAEAWGRRMSAAKVPWPRLVAQHGEPPPGRRSRVDRPPPQCVGWDTSRACRTWASNPRRPRFRPTLDEHAVRGWSTDITSAPDRQSTTARTDLDETEAACPACPHPRDAHDAIGTRYCTATIASGAVGRGCVCRLPG